MDSEADQEGRGQGEADYHEISIAEAIFGGLSEIADALRSIGEAIKYQYSQDEGVPQEQNGYLDGSSPE